MGKVGPIFPRLLFMIICLAMVSMVQSTVEEGHEDIDQWFQNLCHAQQKLTHLHFYLHEVFLGPNLTSVVVAQAPNASSSPTLFGLVNIVDDLLTIGPDPTSEPLGRGQGLNGFASQEEMSLVFAMNYVFTGGEYNGSSFTILGRNPIQRVVREMPIVGGTGVFRLARGFATIKNYLFNSSMAIIEYNVAVLHY